MVGGAGMVGIVIVDDVVGGGIVGGVEGAGIAGSVVEGAGIAGSVVEGAGSAGSVVEGAGSAGSMVEGAASGGIAGIAGIAGIVNGGIAGIAGIGGSESGCSAGSAGIAGNPGCADFEPGAESSSSGVTAAEVSPSGAVEVSSLELEQPPSMSPITTPTIFNETRVTESMSSYLLFGSALHAQGRHRS